MDETKMQKLLGHHVKSLPDTQKLCRAIIGQLIEWLVLNKKFVALILDSIHPAFLHHPQVEQDLIGVLLEFGAIKYGLSFRTKQQAEMIRNYPLHNAKFISVLVDRGDPIVESSVLNEDETSYVEYYALSLIIRLLPHPHTSD